MRPQFVSLEELQDREHALHDTHDPYHGYSDSTATDRFMEMNYGSMGEDSEEVAVREKRKGKVLLNGQVPNYQPY